MPASPPPPLDDDCAESIFLALRHVHDVGRLAQVAVMFARAASGVPVQAKWALRMRVLQHSARLLQPALLPMKDTRRPDDSFDLTFGTTAAVTTCQQRLLTCTADARSHVWLNSWTLAPGAVPVIDRRLQLPEYSGAGIAISASGEHAVVTCYDGAGLIFSSDLTVRTPLLAAGAMVNLDDAPPKTAVAVLGERVYSADWEGDVAAHLLATGAMCTQFQLDDLLSEDDDYIRVVDMATDGRQTLYLATQVQRVSYFLLLTAYCLLPIAYLAARSTESS